MPLPKPRQGESRADFVGRCISSDTMSSEYPEEGQRAVVCYSQWRQRNNDAQFKSYSVKLNYVSTTPVRHETLEGQEHLVVPVIMMVEGVHHGSGGPMLYLPEEFGKDVFLWNGVPVPILHPTENGDPISCNMPQVINEYNIGRVYNAVYDEGKLKAEIWINMERAQKVCPELVPMIQAGMQIQVSTGLYSIDEMVPGTWNGEQYQGIVRDIRPDHLAILPGQEGACNWEDGCGIRLNQEGGDLMPKKVANEKEAKELVQDISTNIEKPEKRNWVASKLASLARYFGVTITNNLASDEQIRRQLQTEVDKLDQPGEPQPGIYHYVVAVYTDENFFVYEARSGAESKLYKQNFEVVEDVASPKGEPVEVREERQFVAASKGGAGGVTDDKEIDRVKVNKEVKEMSKRQKKVDELIANGVFCDTQRDWLMGLDNESFENMSGMRDRLDANYNKTIEKLKANQKEEPEPELKNNEGEEVTVEQFIANAPEDIGSLLQEGLDLRNQRKTALVEGLVANEGCSFTKEELEKHDVPTLEKLVQLAKAGQPKNFAGRGGNVVDITPKNNERKEDGSGVPDMPDLVANIQAERK